MYLYYSLPYLKIQFINRSRGIFYKNMHESLNKLSVEERMEKFQLKPDRADVIVPAGNIFLTIADIIHATHIYVPVIGLADGIIDGLYASHLEEKQKILGILPSKKDVSGTPEDAEE